LFRVQALVVKLQLDSVLQGSNGADDGGSHSEEFVVSNSLRLRGAKLPGTSRQDEQTVGWNTATSSSAGD
jgi:hypothetical protein